MRLGRPLPRRSTSTRTALARVALLATALIAASASSGCEGKGVGGQCADIDACGGSPDGLIGTWDITGDCEYGVPQPELLMSQMAPGVTQPQTPSLAPAPNQPTTTAGDWCSGLIYLPNIVAGEMTNVQSIQFYHAPLEFQQGNIQFTADHTYSITTTLAKEQTTHFTRGCLNAYGANPSCDDLATGLQNYPNPNYEPPLKADGTPMDRIPCVQPPGDDGCDCTYSLEGTGSDTGVWQIDSTQTVIFEYSYASGNAPQQVSYCVHPDGMTLDLGGYNGSSLTGSLGLRALQLHKRAE